MHQRAEATLTLGAERGRKARAAGGREKLTNATRTPNNNPQTPPRPTTRPPPPRADGQPSTDPPQELFVLMHFLDPAKFPDPESVAAEFHDLNHEEQVAAAGGGGGAVAGAVIVSLRRSVAFVA